MHKYSVGQKVVFTNEFGVCWDVKTITSLEPGLTDADGPRYHIEPTDTPWFPTSEKNLQPADNHDIMAMHFRWFARDKYFRDKYGRDTTQEELDSVLDGDPWDGER